MTGNDFKRFLDMVSKDPALQAELNKTTNVEDFTSVAISLARDAGLHFSTGDVAKAMVAEAAEIQESIALSDEQLDAVAGGEGGCQNTMQHGVTALACNYNLKLNWKVKY